MCARVCETPHVSICMQNANGNTHLRQREMHGGLRPCACACACALCAPPFSGSPRLHLCSEGHRQKHNDEEDDSDKQRISERERQGTVAMEMTYSQLPHPIVVACGVIGFEMKEGRGSRGGTAGEKEGK